MWSVEVLDKFKEILFSGGVVAAPAEGVYGYCADPFNEDALARILTLKQRDARKGFIVLVADAQGLERVCGPLDGAAQAAVDRYWRADEVPTTLLLPYSAEIPDILRGGFDKIAVRRPFVGYMQTYLQAWGGPLVSTSLNVSGAPAATSARDIPAAIFGLALADDLSGVPSRIYDVEAGVFLR